MGVGVITTMSQAMVPGLITSVTMQIVTMNSVTVHSVKSVTVQVTQSVHPQKFV